MTPENHRLGTRELAMLAAVQRGEDSGREVNADWLETEGRLAEAGYVRTELKLQRATASLDQLREAGKRVSPEFRAWVSRPALENCSLHFEFRCPLKWESLQPTADARVRECSACQKQVRFCGSVTEAASWTQKGACVAVDVGEPRRPGDLERVYVRMGRVARNPMRPIL